VPSSDTLKPRDWQERRTVSTKDQLTPRQRLTRGLQYTAVGPVDITRGTVGLSMHGLYSAGSGIRRRYRASRVAEELGAAQEAVSRELAAAQEVVASLPQALAEARQPRHRGRRLAVATAVGVAVLAGGAVAFSIIRRSMQPDPSPRPPSVDVEPKP
jgi:Cell wall synthesis protein CwsA